MGRGHLLLGRQNSRYRSVIVTHGSPNCVLLCFVGRQLPNVENHCSRDQTYLYNTAFKEKQEVQKIVIKCTVLLSFFQDLNKSKQIEFLSFAFLFKI